MKPDTSLTESLLDLDQGICLWIGAGVSAHLANALGGIVPDWNGLTKKLEKMAKIKSSTEPRCRTRNACKNVWRFSDVRRSAKPCRGVSVANSASLLRLLP